MVVIGLAAECLGDGGLSAADHLRRQVARTDEEEEHEAYRCCGEGGEQCVGHGMAEDTPRVFLVTDGGQCDHDGQHDGGHGEELEQSRIDGGDEVHQCVEPAPAQHAEDGTHNECPYPQHELPAVFHDVLSSLGVILVYVIHCVILFLVITHSGWELFL